MSEEKVKVSEFANTFRERKPEFKHLDDADIIQLVTNKKPEMIGMIDSGEFVKVKD